MISILADNSNGYGKKETKTQMSYSVNLFRLCEDNHSTGLANSRDDFGDNFKLDYIEKSHSTLAFLPKYYSE
jgi:hypothetical protein